MLIVFMLIMLIGIVGFSLVFMEAFKGRAMADRASLRKDAPGPQAVLAVSSAVESARTVEPKAIHETAEDRIAKLEELLAEKNRMIAALQQGLKAGEDHGPQLEDLKGIFQAQIEGLKKNNRQLKDDLARLSEENLDLQTRVYGAQVSRTEPGQRIMVMPADEDRRGAASLRDVFGE